MLVFIFWQLSCHYLFKRLNRYRDRGSNLNLLHAKMLVKCLLACSQRLLCKVLVDSNVRFNVPQFWTWGDKPCNIKASKELSLRKNYLNRGECSFDDIYFACQGSLSICMLFCLSRDFFTIDSIFWPMLSGYAWSTNS